MGTLGKYLREAREARGIDLRDAAQHTRIGINYLKALEEENFAKLPGAVFVRGFLKNYVKFLHLDESEAVKRYEELRQPQVGPSVGVAKANDRVQQHPTEVVHEQETAPKPKAPLEPFVWAAGILIALILFLFTGLPERHQGEVRPAAAPTPADQIVPPVSAPASKPEKLYLDVVALENTWLLVRTDISPQKKTVLKKGESLIWSADERFQLSYARASAIKLTLNGRELAVNEPQNIVIRDLVITASGIVGRKMQPEYAEPVHRRRRQEAPPQEAQPSQPQPAVPAAQPQPAQPEAIHEPQRTQETTPPAPAVFSPAQRVPPASPEPQRAPTQ